MVTQILLMLAAMFLHELGHASAALVFGVRVYRIGICPLGLYTARDFSGNGFVDGFISLAGPLTSLAFLLLACAEGWFVFALANLCLVAASALPFRGTDFYNVFQAWGLTSAYRIRVRLAEVRR
jgi:Zn-dependent protease